MAPIIGKAKAAVDISIAYLTGIRHLFHRPYTLRFPQQRYAVEKGYRGGICSILIDVLAVVYVPGSARRNASRLCLEASGGIRSTFTAVVVSATSV